VGSIRPGNLVEQVFRQSAPICFSLRDKDLRIQARTRDAMHCHNADIYVLEQSGLLRNVYGQSVVWGRSVVWLSSRGARQHAIRMGQRAGTAVAVSSTRTIATSKGSAQHRCVVEKKKECLNAARSSLRLQRRRLKLLRERLIEQRHSIIKQRKKFLEALVWRAKAWTELAASFPRLP
jgi:hypothetical protein